MPEQITTLEQKTEIYTNFQTSLSAKDIEQMALLVAKGLTKYENNLPGAQTDLKNHLKNSQTLIAKNSQGQIVGFCICCQLPAHILDISVISPILPGVGKKMLTKVAETFNDKPLIVLATQNSRMLGCAVSAFGSKNLISSENDRAKVMAIAFARSVAKFKGNSKKIDNQNKVKNYYGQSGLYQENINENSKNIVKIDTSKSGDAFVFVFQNPNYN